MSESADEDKDFPPQANSAKEVTNYQKSPVSRAFLVPIFIPIFLLDFIPEWVYN